MRNASTDTATALSTDALPWLPLGPGIEVRVIATDAQTGRWTVRIRMLPGSTLQPHRHIGASDFLILQGRGTHPQAGDFKAGDYAHEPAGAVHSEVRAEQEVQLFMVSHGPSEFISASGDPIRTSDAHFFRDLAASGAASLAARRFFLVTLWGAFNRIRRPLRGW